MHCDDKECMFYDRLLGQCMADSCMAEQEEPEQEESYEN